LISLDQSDGLVVLDYRLECNKYRLLNCVIHLATMNGLSLDSNDGSMVWEDMLADYSASTQELQQWEHLEAILSQALNTLACSYRTAKQSSHIGRIPDPAARYKFLSWMIREAIDKLRDSEEQCRAFKIDKAAPVEAGLIQGITNECMKEKLAVVKGKVDDAKRLYYRRNETLRTLEAGHQKARNQNILKRYGSLKLYIKEAIRDSSNHMDSDTSHSQDYGY